MKAQSALEYLLIMVLTLGIIVPTIYLIYSYSKQSTEQIIYPQINDIGINIINNAESVYYSGDYSKIVIEVNMPDKINDIYILNNKELVFNISTALGDNEMIFFTNSNLTSNSCTAEKCNLPNISSFGTKSIKLESFNQGEQVLIEKI